MKVRPMATEKAKSELWSMTGFVYETYGREMHNSLIGKGTRRNLIFRLADMLWNGKSLIWYRISE